MMMMIRIALLLDACQHLAVLQKVHSYLNDGNEEEGINEKKIDSVRHITITIPKTITTAINTRLIMIMNIIILIMSQRENYEKEK